MTSISSQDREMAALWWADLLPTVPGEAVGLWFGLTELVIGDGTATTLYVAGTSEFDRTDATGDWAANVVWESEGRYVTPPGLALISGSDWLSALDYATDLVGLVVDPETLPPTVKGIGLGWDDGEVRIIWSRT